MVGPGKTYSNHRSTPPIAQLRLSFPLIMTETELVYQQVADNAAILDCLENQHARSHGTSGSPIGQLPGRSGIEITRFKLLVEAQQRGEPVPRRWARRGTDCPSRCVWNRRRRRGAYSRHCRRRFLRRPDPHLPDPSTRPSRTRPCQRHRPPHCRLGRPPACRELPGRDSAHVPAPRSRRDLRRRVQHAALGVLDHLIRPPAHGSSPA